MKQFFGKLGLALAGLVALGGVAWAVDSPYDVTGVRVDASAESASAARDVGLGQGYETALTTLLQRNTLRQDWGRLPAVSAADAQSYVRSFSVAAEKASRTRYLARINVSFKAEAVRGLLRQSGIAFSETVSKPVLVLPVWQVGSRFVLWGDPNPWRDAWSREAGRFNGLLPVQVPEGDLEDMRFIDGAAAVAGDEAALNAIAQHYGVSKVAVSHGRLLVDAETDESYAQIVTKVYGAAAKIEITDQQFVPGGDKTAFFRKLAEAAIGDMNEDWKAKTLVRFGEAGQLMAYVPVQGLEQWVRLRQTIEDVAAVQNVKVASLSVSEAQLYLTYRGGLQQLAFSLGERNLDLLDDGHGGYIIRPKQ